MAVKSMASRARRRAVTTWPRSSALTTPKLGMGAVGCTMMMPYKSKSRRPRARLRVAVGVFVGKGWVAIKIRRRLQAGDLLLNRINYEHSRNRVKEKRQS